MKKKTSGFDTLLIRLHQPFCTCLSAQKPSKNAFAIFLPQGGSPLTIRCKSCGKELQVADKELNGTVVYRSPGVVSPEPQPPAKAKRTPAEWEHSQEAARQWVTPPTPKWVPRPADNQEPGAQDDPRAALTKPEEKPADQDSTDEPPDTRPAYMRVLGLEEQQ